MVLRGDRHRGRGERRDPSPDPLGEFGDPPADGAELVGQIRQGSGGLGVDLDLLLLQLGGDRADFGRLR